MDVHVVNIIFLQTQVQYIKANKREYRKFQIRKSILNHVIFFTTRTQTIRS